MQHIINHKHKVEITHPIDSIALIVGIVQPFATIPQIILTYTAQDASQVSFAMWLIFNIASAVLLVYGIKHKLAPIWFPQIIWILVQTPMMLSPFIFN
jgi:uncharacterized protein with PQ loop repeat